MRKIIKSQKVKYFKLLNAAQLRKFLRVSQATLSRFVKNRDIVRIGYGFYTHPECSISPEEIDFAVACARFGPSSSIGGLTALFHYNLIDQPPSQIWIITPPKKSDHNIFYRTLRTKTSPKVGVNHFEFYRMTSIERTIIEALKFKTKIGERVAINAARKALQKKWTTEKKLGEMASKLNLRSTIEKYWEFIVE